MQALSESVEVMGITSPWGGRQELYAISMQKQLVENGTNSRAGWAQSCQFTYSGALLLSCSPVAAYLL